MALALVMSMGAGHRHRLASPLPSNSSLTPLFVFSTGICNCCAKVDKDAPLSLKKHSRHRCALPADLHHLRRHPRLRLLPLVLHWRHDGAPLRAGLPRQPLRRRHEGESAKGLLPTHSAGPGGAAGGRAERRHDEPAPLRALRRRVPVDRVRRRQPRADCRLRL